MQGFTKKGGLPTYLRHWEETVDAMLEGIETDGKIFLMVDQNLVKAGNTLRRPGLHVDGYWHDGSMSLSGHNHPSGHYFDPPATPSKPVEKPPEKKPKAKPENLPWLPASNQTNYKHAGHQMAGMEKEAILLASNIFGCVAFTGNYEELPQDKGDCAHIDTSGLKRVEMAPNVVWAGHCLTMLHESVPVKRDCLRTVVRLNVQGWTP